MKIGIIGGSFNPIHHGHIRLARKAASELCLDRVYFVLSSANPLKQDYSVSGFHRYAMLCLALNRSSSFYPSACELDRGGKSYTFDTLNFFREKFPDSSLFFLLGADNIREFHKWHRWQELSGFAQFVFFDRSSKNSELDIPGARFLDFCCSISSTDIRTRISEGKTCHNFVPAAVYRYIIRHLLYRK